MSDYLLAVIVFFARCRKRVSALLSLGVGAILLHATAYGLDPSKSLLQYNCRTWTRQNGLPTTAVRALAQSSDGYLWLGTQKGLVRFDGVDFSISTLPANFLWQGRIVSKLEAGADREIWLGLESGALGSYDAETGTLSPAKIAGNRGTNIVALHRSSDGALWISEQDNLIRWVPGNTNESFAKHDIGTALCIEEDAKHRVWLGLQNGGLHYWEAGNFKRFVDPEIEYESVSAVAFDPDGNLWVAARPGLRCYDSQFRLKQTVSIYATIQALLCDRAGVLWVGTRGDGLARFQKNGTMEVLRRGNGLAGDSVTALLEDKEGSIWVGAREGLSQLSDVKFPIFTTENGLAAGACHGVAPATKGGIWIASVVGISWMDGKSSTNYSVQEGLRSPYIKRVLQASDGDVYFFDGDRNIEILSDGHVVACYTNSNWPTALAEDNHGVVASVGGDLFRVSRKGITPFAYKPGAIEPTFYWIRNLLRCSDGSLLVATGANGLFRIRDGAIVQHWSNEQGLHDLDIYGLCEDEEKTIWITQPSGLSRLKNNRIVPIAGELAEGALSGIVADRSGNLWISSSRGYIRINRKSANDVADGKSSALVATLFDGPECVKTVDSSEVEYLGCLSTDGNVWFPTPQGPARISPDNIVINKAAPGIYIQSVSINGVVKSPTEIKEISPGKGDLVFQFSAVSLQSPQRVHFRYKLEGYETDWVDAGSRRSASYANLKPGKYQFVVQACNADGLWNEAGSTVGITLPSRYYQTVWFYVVVAVGMGSLLFGIYAWRITLINRKQHNLQLANQALENKVRERTQELSEQRNQLRTLIDHLPDEIYVKDSRGRVLIDNLAHARHMGFNNPADAIGKTDFEFMAEDKAQQLRKSELVLLNSGKDYNAEECITFQNGETRWFQTTKVPVRDDHGEIIGLAGIARDITERKQSEAELKSMHKQLLQSSRQAGMAEVATSVLHNVGNVLNSVNVSASIVEQQVRNSALERLNKVVDLLKENQADLANFFTNSEKGPKIIGYLDALYKMLLREQDKVRDEIGSLTRNVEHIKKIVSMQQSYARIGGVAETVSPTELMEDSLRMHEAGMQRHGVRVVREYAEVPTISVDRHKVIQILVNLLQNAKYACDVNDGGNRLVRLSISQVGANRVRMEVTDNGMGIAAENLTRIFSYGFTTRKNGHGFGLHSGALAAKEMGGSLSAHSEGVGKGASFVLELPLEKDSEPEDSDVPAEEAVS